MKAYKVKDLKIKEGGNRMAQVVRVSDGQEMLYGYKSENLAPTWMAQAKREAKAMNEGTGRGMYLIAKAEKAQSSKK